MRVIAIAGRKNSGKDYLADMLTEKISGAKKYALADPLKEYVARRLHISVEDLNSRKDTDDEFRYEHLQKRADDLKAVFGNDLFVNALVRKIKTEEPFLAIISDLRRLHELYDLDLIIPSIFVIKIKDDNLPNDDGHPTETEVDELRYDHLIDNTGHPDLEPLLPLCKNCHFFSPLELEPDSIGRCYLRDKPWATCQDHFCVSFERSVK